MRSGTNCALDWRGLLKGHWARGVLQIARMALPLRDRKSIGEAVRLHRERAGLSQEEVAARAQVRLVSLLEIECGEQTASIRALVKIAGAVGIRIRDLV